MDASTTLRTNETASSPLAPDNAAVPPLTAPVCNANGAEGRVPMIVHPGNGDSGVVKAEVAEVEGSVGEWWNKLRWNLTRLLPAGD